MKFINQVMIGQVGFNFSTPNLTKLISQQCGIYSKKETMGDYSFNCQKYQLQRQVLERETEKILTKTQLPRQSSTLMSFQEIEMKYGALSM